MEKDDFKSLLYHRKKDFAKKTPRKKINPPIPIFDRNGESRVPMSLLPNTGRPPILLGHEDNVIYHESSSIVIDPFESLYSYEDSVDEQKETVESFRTDDDETDSDESGQDTSNEKDEDTNDEFSDDEESVYCTIFPESNVKGGDINDLANAALLKKYQKMEIEKARNQKIKEDDLKYSQMLNGDKHKYDLKNEYGDKYESELVDDSGIYTKFYKKTDIPFDIYEDSTLSSADIEPSRPYIDNTWRIDAYYKKNLPVAPVKEWPFDVESEPFLIFNYTYTYPRPSIKGFPISSIRQTTAQRDLMESQMAYFIVLNPSAFANSHPGKKGRFSIVPLLTFDSHENIMTSGFGSLSPTSIEYHNAREVLNFANSPTISKLQEMIPDAPRDGREADLLLLYNAIYRLGTDLEVIRYSIRMFYGNRKMHGIHESMRMPLYDYLSFIKQFIRHYRIAFPQIFRKVSNHYSEKTMDNILGAFAPLIQKVRQNGNFIMKWTDTEFDNYLNTHSTIRPRPEPGFMYDPKSKMVIPPLIPIPATAYRSTSTSNGQVSYMGPEETRARLFARNIGREH
jgi:hypothetical protein